MGGFIALDFSFGNLRRGELTKSAQEPENSMLTDWRMLKEVALWCISWHLLYLGSFYVVEEGTLIEKMLPPNCTLDKSVVHFLIDDCSLV